MSYPAYPEYKNSGVEWLGEVPAHWHLCRFKQVFQERMGRSEDGSGELLSVSAYWGVRPRSERREEGEHLSRADSLEGYKLCQSGDLVMNIMLAWNRGLGFAWQSGIVSPAYSVFYVVDDSEPRFLDYLVRSDEYTRYYKAFSAGVIDSRLRLYPEVFGRLTCALPTYGEQIHIATFLDHETTRIDALVEEQQRLIALLKEKRQAVISHAVTKGLDPNVPMKDSGVEWLREVPEHWEVGSLKYALEVVADVDHYMPTSVDSGVPYVMTGDLSRLVSEIDLDSCKKVTREDYQKLSRKIKTSKGDVIMARYATIGSVSYVDIDEEFIVSYSCVTIRPRAELTTGIYLFYYFQSDAFIQGISNMINANTQENVGVGDLKEVKVTLPNIQVQKAIADELEVRLTNLDRITKSSKTTIHLLKERRYALISAAVTGKIDVRGWQPPEVSAAQEASQQEAV